MYTLNLNRDMKRNNFGKIGIIIAVSTTVLHYYFEIIDIYVNGIISAIALVFLLISLYDRFTGRKWIRDMKKISWVNKVIIICTIVICLVYIQFK